mmetsp:Transcript_13840/g.35315  ORF Transcript_13840/g.35315 Transcript_13840/m.35315 type:complete len:269 (+) Transcript_13840:235-1041(+)
MHVTVRIRPIRHHALHRLLDRRHNIPGDGPRLRVGHQPPRPQNPPDLPHDAHDVRRRDDPRECVPSPRAQIRNLPAAGCAAVGRRGGVVAGDEGVGGDGLGEVFGADVGGAGGEGGRRGVPVAGEDGDAGGLGGAVGEGEGAAEVFVGFAWVDIQLEDDLERLVKLAAGRGAHVVQRLRERPLAFAVKNVLDPLRVVILPRLPARRHRLPTRTAAYLSAARRAARRAAARRVGVGVDGRGLGLGRGAKTAGGIRKRGKGVGDGGGARG